MLKELIKKSRSYRRFEENQKIKKHDLQELIDLARLGPSAANKQPIKYIISNDKNINNEIFPELSWAGYIENWNGPKKGERPSAYIIMLGDKNISKNFWDDPGIAAQNIMLGAAEKKLGGCILGAVDRENIRSKLDINDNYDILYVLALGKPKEKVELESVNENGNIKYWRDDNSIHHVPKRELSEIIIKKF